MAEARRLAARIAAVDLPGPDEESVGPLRIPAAEWPELLRLLVAEGLTGLAVRAAETGALALDGERREGLLRHHRAVMLHVLALERRLVALLGAFERAGVDVRVLKGPVLAHTVYPDAALRPFADLDLLVRTRDWRAARALLERAGFGRASPEPRPGFDERFVKAAVFRDARGLEVDLHRTLAAGPFGLWMAPEALFEDATLASVGGTTVPGLGRTALLLHACLHAVLGAAPPLLLPVRDVAQIVGDGAEVDWQRLAELGDRWRARAPLARALTAASTLLGFALPAEAEALVRARIARREERTLAAYTSGRREQGGVALATLAALPGARSKAAYAMAMLAPRREFLEARTRGRPSYLRRWTVPLRWVAARTGRAPRRVTPGRSAGRDEGPTSRE